MAWDKFFKQVSQAVYGEGHYDADEGIEIIENGRITHLEEGWIHY